MMLYSGPGERRRDHDERRPNEADSDKARAVSIEDYLQSVSLVDCTGSVTHTLTLLIDGTVRVRIGRVDAVVDLSTRTSRPGTVRLGCGEYTHDQVVNLACDLARGA